MYPTEKELLALFETLQLDIPVDVSLGWLIDDKNALLEWFYNNITTDNCLTPSEKLKYKEITEVGKYLEGEALETALLDLKEKHGLVRMTDEELNDMEIECDHIQKVVSYLEEQEEYNQKLLEEEKRINHNILKELRMTEILLKEELENFENDINACDAIIEEAKNKKMTYAKMLNDILHSSTKKKCFNSILISEQPLDLYFDKTKQLQSYTKLYMSRQFVNFNEREFGANKTSYGDEFEESAEMNGKILKSCNRLEEALRFYLMKKTLMEDLNSQMNFINNYEFDPCCDVQLEIIRCNGKLNTLMENSEVLCDGEVQMAIENFVKKQCEKVMLGECLQKLEKSKYFYNKLCDLKKLTEDCLEFDTLLYVCLMRDQNIAQSLLRISSQTVNYLKNDIISHKSRSFNPSSLRPTDRAWETVKKILYDEDQSPIAVYQKLTEDISKLETTVFENMFLEFSNIIKSNQEKMVPMKKFIWDGPTRQPNIMSYSLNIRLYKMYKTYEEIENIVNDSSRKLMEYKTKTEKEPKINKFWMWFLIGKPDEFIKELRTKH